VTCFKPWDKMTAIEKVADAGLLELPQWYGDESRFISEHGGSTFAEIFLNLTCKWGRNDGPWLLDLWMAEAQIFSDGFLSDVLADIWCAAENPESGVPRATWRKWFQMAAYQKPSGPLKVYRGATAHHRLGMSWTLSKKQATWFAQRYTAATSGRPTHVYGAIADPDAVLCLVDEACSDGGRDEQEVVISPRRLREISRLPANRGAN